MADVCVVCLSEDEAVVERLVALLRKRWSVWWARDIAHGDWEEAVRSEIPKSLALVPVLSRHAKGKRTKILKDEMRLADDQNIPVLPFLIGPAEIPLGFGGLNHTEAYNWLGDEGHEGYQHLVAKISTTIGNGRNGHGIVRRTQELTVRGKTLRLPAFVFSLSSHETQLMPNDGATLLRLLEPRAMLVSAYDIWKSRQRREETPLRSSLTQLRQSETALFLDSGNYEAYRRDDRYSPKKNPTGWQKAHFRETAARLSPDLAFSFDTINPKGDSDRVAARIIVDFRADDRAIRQRDFPLIPIIHLPSGWEMADPDCAARIVAAVASELDPLMLAVPERELGDGLTVRARTVRNIRKALDALGKYYPIHLLGTGNPLSMIVLAAAGADAFDGLEWCRTVADYGTGHLFHFQQFEFFSQACLHQVQDQKTKLIIENPDASYTMRALSYNVDFFKDWTRTMQDLIHSGQVRALLKSVPNIGPTLVKDLST